MAKAKGSKLSRAARLAALRTRLIMHLDDVQAKIARLTPLKTCAQLLRDGNVSPAWFVQRLIDSGMSLASAKDEYHKIRHGPGGESVAELPEILAGEHECPSLHIVHKGPWKRERQPTLNAPQLRMYESGSQ